VSHDTATGLHRRTASEAARPASHRLLRARYLFVPLHFYLVLWHRFLLHAESFCIQEDGRGKIISPPPTILHAGGWEGFSGPGQFWPSPYVWAGSGPDPKKQNELLGRDRPNPFGAEFGLVISAGPAHIIIILYIIILLYYIIYIYIYIYIYVKISKKNCLFSCIFLSKLLNTGLYFYSLRIQIQY